MVHYDFFRLSFHRGLGANADGSHGEEDPGERRLLWTLPWHPAQLHEGHTGCEHQLRGVRVLAVGPGYPEVGKQSRPFPAVYLIYFIFLLFQHTSPYFLSFFLNKLFTQRSTKFKLKWIQMEPHL